MGAHTRRRATRGAGRSSAKAIVIVLAFIFLRPIVTAADEGEGLPEPAAPLYVELPESHSGGMWNWDFTCGDPGCNVASRVSFPISLIWYNNAEIDLVKNLYGNNGFCSLCTGSRKYGYLKDPDRDATFYLWDQDSGRKRDDGQAGYTHFREYADSVDDQMNYSLGWGYWTFGAVHHDHYENTPSEYFGYSETEEATMTAVARTWTAYSFDDETDLKNPVHVWFDTKHYASGDGWASVMRIP